MSDHSNIDQSYSDVAPSQSPSDADAASGPTNYIAALEESGAIDPRQEDAVSKTADLTQVSPEEPDPGPEPDTGPDVGEKADARSTDGADIGEDQSSPAQLFEVAPASEQLPQGPTGEEDGAMAPSSDKAVPDVRPGSATNVLSAFPAAPQEHGEFLVSLSDLVIGERSLGGVYDLESGAGDSLRHVALDPQALAPVMVIETDGAWHVVDGWARVMALRFRFGGTANIMVRAVAWNGTFNGALYNRFAATFLKTNSRKIDKALLLRQLHLAWNVPQLILGARIGWKPSKVTKELAAAKAFEEAPRFAVLHQRASDPPTDYLYKVQQAREAAAEDDKAHPKRAQDKSAVAKLSAKLEALLAKPERFATAEALAKLGIGKPVKAKPKAQASEEPNAAADLEAREIIDSVEDSGGEPVAMVEIGPDQLPSIRLVVDTTAMDDRRRAEVRHLIHEALDKLLGF